MVIKIILSVIIFILISKIIFDLYYIRISKKIISETEIVTYIPKKVKILMIIPALREQKIIIRTLNHFQSMRMENIELIVCVAGTSREKKNKPTEYTSTGDIVNDWIIENQNGTDGKIRFTYSEVSELDGDRATQLNHAVIESTNYFNPDIIGVYDADSLPDERTLLEVATVFCENPNIVLQQPVNFIDASNRMSIQKRNPILIANALYQTTWTVIRELARWCGHSNFCKKHPDKLYYRNDYLIGHGEFIPYTIYCKYKFPENEVTDGIQLGYRISMSGLEIRPLHTFCMDDVPQELSQLIGQHKRWFGGCNRLIRAYNWSKKNTGKASIFQVIDGYWSQISWAYASLIVIIGIIISIIEAVKGNIIWLIFISVLVTFYCYVVPYVAHKIFPVKLKIRFIDWLCLPIAIVIKGIGPNMYLVQRIWGIISNKKISYSKVER